MQLKRIAILTAMVSSVALGSVSAVLADSGTPTPVVRGATARQTEVAARLPTAIADRHALADAQITDRIDLLNKVIARLQSDTHLNANDKSLLLAEDQTAVSGLTSLKAKIDADTATADLQADIKQIATFHVRDILLPQNRELVMVDNLQATSATVGTTIATVQTKVTALQGQGANVSAIQALLTDASNKLTTINSTLSSDEQSLAATTPSSTNASATFSKVRADIATLRGDFTGVRDDLKQVRQDAKSMATGTPAATVTPTPTP